MRKPFYWRARRCWYVKTEDHRNLRLHPDEQTAMRLWQEMCQSNVAIAPVDPIERTAEIQRDLVKLLAILEELSAQQESLVGQLKESERRTAALREQAKNRLLELAQLQSPHRLDGSVARPSPSENGNTAE